jgi:hypothetical protein
LADSQALGVKVADRKWITPMYLGLSEGGMYQAVSLGWESEISNAIKPV